jgi:hypothetical protein
MYVHDELPYLEVLRRVHETLRPSVYVEVGVHFGRSLALAAPSTRCLGIDPEPCIEVDLPPVTRLIETTSDDFFDSTTVADTVGMPADVSFIDGMHLFEFALRDFRALERDSRPDSVILFHDCRPKDVAWGERGVRSGDVWKVLVALAEFRPDLTISTIDAAPTGLGLVTGLDPGNRVLWDRYEEILERCMPLSYAEIVATDAFPIGPVPATWRAIRPQLPRSPYQRGSLRDSGRVVRRRTTRYVRPRARSQYLRLRRGIKRIVPSSSAQT